MKIDKQYLTISNYNRPGTMRGRTSAIACHYIGNPGTSAQANSYTISIESCHPDSTGKFTDATYVAYVELCADICTRWGLDPLNGGLIRHYDVTRKICPKWFVDKPDVWECFKGDVAEAMQPIRKSGWHDEDGIRRFYNGDTVRPE